MSWDLHAGMYPRNTSYKCLQRMSIFTSTMNRFLQLCKSYQFQPPTLSKASSTFLADILIFLLVTACPPAWSKTSLFSLVEIYKIYMKPYYMCHIKINKYKLMKTSNTTTSTTYILTNDSNKVFSIIRDVCKKRAAHLLNFDLQNCGPAPFQIFVSISS